MASQRRRSAWVRMTSAICGLPTSSSPSIKRMTFTGRRPHTARQVSSARESLATAGCDNVEFLHADLFGLPSQASHSIIFSCALCSSTYQAR
jgi:hypothetical protein